MLDLLVIWGVAQTAGLVFKPIFEDLVKDAAKDYVKDFFKDSLKNVLQLPKKDPAIAAMGKALKEFLQLVQQELEDANLDEEELKQYIKPFEQFIKDKSVAAVLGSAFQAEIQVLDTKTLAAVWTGLRSPDLPDGFDWEQLAKRYLKKVKAIRRESDELREILDSQNIENVADSLAEMAGVSPDFDLRRYREGILERYGQLKLESLETSGYAYNDLKLWRMFIPQNVRETREFLPQVYEIPKEYYRRLKESGQVDNDLSPDELERFKTIYAQQPIQSVLEIVKESACRYLVILGDPGSGKSSLLQYIALEWAELPDKERPLHPIPLLIELRQYIRDRDSGQCQNFLEFFHKGTVTCHLNQLKLHERLKAGDAIALFDGLDEVFDPAKREAAITEIHRFTNEYPKVRAIATSRIIGYKPQRLRDAEFRHFVLQDLEGDQIEEFIQRWHDLTYNNETEKAIKRDRLKKAIADSSAIAELAGNPLLLTMMAILNRHQELPRDRAELYNQASRVLLHQWDVERTLTDSRLEAKAIDYKDKQAMLRQVAYQMQASEKGLAGNLISSDRLEKIVTDFLKVNEVSEARSVAKLLIEQLRHRNFILCYWGADYYAFVHRTFLEYFCASEFVERFNKRGLEGGLTLEQLKAEVFGKHWREESWHEVLRLIAGAINASFAGELIEYLMAEQGEADKFLNVFLAAKCLAEVRTRSNIAPTATQLLNQLKNLTQYDLSYYYEPYGDEAKLVREIRIQAVAAMAATWKEDPDTLTWIKQCAICDRDSDVRQAAVQELARGWKDDPDTLTILKQCATYDDHPVVRQVAVQELARGWKNRPDTLTILKQRATSDEYAAVRQGAVQELARCWKDDPDTLTILKQCAIYDRDSDVRQAAVQELARCWKDRPDTLTWLKQRATSDRDSDVRQAAVQELARCWKDDPDTLSWLKQRATSDYHWAVRQVVVRELARGWKDRPDTLSWLKQHATSDDYPVVRTVAVHELAQDWKDDPDTLTWLKQCATSDRDSAVRTAAVQELARGWKDDPDTLTWLKQRATSDRDSAVRTAAVQELARGWKDDPDTLLILKQRATSDRDSVVRYAAVQELAQGWKDDPGMLEFMRDRAINDPCELHKGSDNPRHIALEFIIKQYPQHPETLPLLRDRAANDPDERVREFAEDQLKKWGNN